MNSGPKRIKTAEKVVSLLEFLHSNGASSLSETADHMSLSRSTTYSYLETLTDQGMIIKSDQRYRVGFKQLEYGGRARSEAQIYRASKAQLHELHQEVGNTVCLAVKENNDIILLERINPQETIRFGGHIGRRGPFHRGALGKAILAHLPEAEVRAIFQKHELEALTENSITSKENLLSELDKVRKRGYAVNDEEEHKNFRGVAYPVLVNTTIEGAISVSGSKTEIKTNEEAIHNCLQSARDIVEINLQYGEDS